MDSLRTNPDVPVFLPIMLHPALQLQTQARAKIQLLRIPKLLLPTCLLSFLSFRLFGIVAFVFHWHFSALLHLDFDLDSPFVPIYAHFQPKNHVPMVLKTQKRR